jgi:hypothetical protein
MEPTRHGRPRAAYAALTLPIALALSGVAGCGGKDPAAPAPPPPTVLKVVVRSGADSTLVQNSNVVLYAADTREAVNRGMTDVRGTIHFCQDPGNYYLAVSAQGFAPTPPENIEPTPFSVAARETTLRDIPLEPCSTGGGTGYVLGSVHPPLDSFLILAESQSTLKKYYTASGPDGVFVVYNLPFGDYTFTALRSGFQATAPGTASLGAGAAVDTVSIGVGPYAGSQLTGSVTFLASQNSVVDITLLDPETRAVIPGLTVTSDTVGLTYRMAQIPDGHYLAWASLRNDGYVIDPDWLFKNPGGLDIVFTTAGTRQLDFSVTDAVTLLSPTNPAANTVPAVADSTVPRFRWAAYPSAKEYFIEVRDLTGQRFWGGFESDGMVNHAFIGPNVLSVRYNFDAQAGVPPLQPGQIYQWRLWVDKGTVNSRVEQLISASEDLLGLFQVPAAAPAR